MSKVRKTLTVRTPFAIFNSTLFEYVVKITDRNNNEILDQALVKPNQKYPIDFAFYDQCNI